VWTEKQRTQAPAKTEEQKGVEDKSPLGLEDGNKYRVSKIKYNCSLVLRYLVS
jgi:hypothetical protein